MYHWELKANVSIAAAGLEVRVISFNTHYVTVQSVASKHHFNLAKVSFLYIYIFTDRRVGKICQQAGS